MFVRKSRHHRSSVIPAKAGIQGFVNPQSSRVATILRSRIFFDTFPASQVQIGRIFIFSAIAFFLLFFTFSAFSASPPDLEDRTREIAIELRCVVCQNLSVADSPSEMAQQMRAVVREQLEAGKTPEQVKEFFVSKYGEWVLLKPKATGFSALLWILPYTALGIGIIAALWIIRRWSKRKTTVNSDQPVTAVQEDSAAQSIAPPDIEDSSARAQFLRERIRLRDELAELDFDFQSGKLSENDYQTLKNQIIGKDLKVMQQLEALPPEPAKKPAKPKSSQPGEKSVAQVRSRRWQLITGGVFLLLFGLGLGVMLTQSVRPRESESDSMTGDFMTGTTPSSGEARAALAEGKQAFAKQDFAKAIEAFKKALASEPNNPEAHAYMGFILVQAGHADGALMAFDKALAVAPNFPMALWGRGMVLYQHNKDYAGAREIFERLLNMMPPGEERNEVAKVLAEIPHAPSGKAAAPAAGPSSKPGTNQISGTISVDPKLKASIDSNAALFIIARQAGGAAGPPLAVKKIDKPSFPLAYSLGQENVMMQGTPFTGKINLTVRLDKDANPVTRTPGDLTGDYKKNPVEVGMKNVDIVIDQVTQ